MLQHYVIALGSNVRHQRYGLPPQMLRAALEALAAEGLVLEAASPVIASAPLGPSRRRYANAAAVVACDLAPPSLLALLQRIEARFGRARRGARWGARTLDLDIVLWNGGTWRSPGLTIPHPAYRTRAFVLGPACAVAPDWRDPHTGCTIRHLHARLTRRAPTPR